MVVIDFSAGQPQKFARLYTKSTVFSCVFLFDLCLRSAYDKNMIIPNYKNGSIVNLMASLANALGGKSRYNPLKGLNEEDLAGKSIILIVLDGLGYNFLQKYGKNSFLKKNLKGKMTSVFPSTTASAITTFTTGLAPQEHALTGWFMYLKEINKVTAALPLIPRGQKKPIKISEEKAKEIYNFKSFFENIKVPSYIITHRDYIYSVYNKAIARRAKKIPNKSLANFFSQIRKTINNNSKRKYIYAYWGGLDSVCHRKGTASRDAVKHFRELDKRMKSLAEFLEDKNTTAIITADHGQIDTKEKNKMIRLENYPEFINFLELPLCGEPRVAYCYVKKSKMKQFENYIRNNFGKMCWLFKSGELVRKNFFGLSMPSKKLASRIGDYILVMKDNYAIKDFVPGEELKIFIGNHGGVSSQEMFVPLIIFSEK